MLWKRFVDVLSKTVLCVKDQIPDLVIYAGHGAVGDDRPVAEEIDRASLKSGGSVTRQGVHELLAVTNETIRLVKEALPDAHANAYGLTSTFHRMSVTAAFWVGDMADKESEDVVVNLDVEPVKFWAAYYRPPESHTGTEVAGMSITTGMGADLVDPLMWPLPGSPGSEESDHAIEMFARAAQDMLRDAVPTILDVLRKEMRDADRR